MGPYNLPRRPSSLYKNRGKTALNSKSYISDRLELPITWQGNKFMDEVRVLK